MKMMMMALVATITLSLTSCIESEKNTPVYMGIAEVQNGLAGTYFKTEAGFDIIPSPTSLLAVESQNKFAPSQTKMAYIAYTFDSESPDNVNAETNKRMHVELTFAISLDCKVESTTQGSSADSVSTAPIVGLNKIGENELSIFDGASGKYLVTAINYFRNQNTHNFSLVHYNAENNDEEIKLYLRHTGTPETGSVAHSVNWALNVPSYYYYTFDLTNLLSGFKGRTGKPSVKITVEADVNTSTNKLDDPYNTKQQYSMIYTFPQ